MASAIDATRTNQDHSRGIGLCSWDGLATVSLSIRGLEARFTSKSVD